MKKGLSIVMPCLNEAKTLPVCIEKAKKYLQTSNLEGEIIIADNGSTDGSVEVAESLGARVVPVISKGYGSALRGGIAAAEYEYVIMADADDSYDFLNLQPFVDKLDEGYDLVMGNRFKGGIEPGAMPWSHQYIGNPVLSGIGRVFYKTKIGDFHCGQRGFRKESILKLGLCTTGMEFASEMVVKAVMYGLKIAEVPCKLYPDGRDRAPHLRSIPDGLRHLKFLLVYSPKWLFVYPGMLLTFVGMILLLILGVHPIQIGRIQFEVTTMFYSAMILLLGTVALQFGMYTDIYGERIGQFPGKSMAILKLEKFIGSKGVIVGMILALISFVGIIYTIHLWSLVDYGSLATTTTCKYAIMFGTLMILGFEMIFSCFFVNVLQMGLDKA